jgi:alanyl-tRNA synthetase
VVTFDKKYSIELCGGCHVPSTGQIGQFKITAEGAVAAGIRRIEAITSIKAEEYYDRQSKLLHEVKELLKQPKDLVKSLSQLVEENHQLQKQLAAFYKEKAAGIKQELKTALVKKGDINFLAKQIDFDNAEELKNLMFELRNEIPNLFCVLASEVNGKPSVSVIIADSLVKEKNINAGAIVRDLAKEINGGGGGQPFYAQAGGTNLAGLSKVIEKAKQLF